MANYRLYHHDHLGHFRSATDLSCVDDAAARCASRKLLKGQPGELWERGRAVHVFSMAPGVTGGPSDGV